jgi:hypothetical protein
MHEKSLSKISIVYYFQNPELSPKRKSTGRYSSAMGLDRIWGISLSLSIISREKKNYRWANIDKKNVHHIVTKK